VLAAALAEMRSPSSAANRSSNMSLIKELLERPPNLSPASVYSVFNGVIYLTAGVLFIVWPGVTQTLFMDRDLVGDERGLIRGERLLQSKY
jgi:hypothetical protein